MSFKIALIGNPNCGKTTLFNSLTKSRQKIGNWAGVTVEQKSATFCENKNIEIVDLPGLYSLNPFSPDEKVSSDFLKNNHVDAIINVVSVVNLERSLYLTLQLLELEIPTVVALTMLDISKKNGDEINFNNFSEIFKCEVLPVFKNDKNNNFKIVNEALNKIKSINFKQNSPKYGLNLEKCVNKIELVLKESGQNLIHPRHSAIEIIENEDLSEKLELNKTQKEQIKNSINLLNNNDEFNNKTLIVNERYGFINRNIKNILLTKKNEHQLSVSDKIDNILINKYIAVPAFIAIISVIYFISIPMLGKPVSEWLDGFFLKTWLIPTTQQILNKLSLKFWLTDLICSGIITGVGSVLVFVPQLFLLFFMLCFLEECGYMSRVSFITNKILSKFGLCGQSIISFLVSSSCGVNGILATKTIKNNTAQLITLTTTTFIPCSAKIPVIASISSLFLTNSWLIAPISYLICIIAILICSLFLKNKNNRNHEESNFFMEILPYQMPHFKHLLADALLNIKSFVFKALTVVLIASVLVWATTNLGFYDGGFGLVSADHSILAKTGQILTPIFKPLGFSSWQTIAASISGLFAKENIVNTLEIIATSTTNNSFSLATLFHNHAAALSFLVFNLLCTPCCIAVSAIFKQTNSFKLTLKIAAFQTLAAWCFSCVSFLLFNFFFKFL